MERGEQGSGTRRWKGFGGREGGCEEDEASERRGGGGGAGADESAGPAIWQVDLCGPGGEREAQVLG
eukprot:768117-Hanusia_phi.AAC.2